MKNILILADTNLLKDGRIRRQILALKDNYWLTVTGIEDPKIEGNIKFLNCSKDPISEKELRIKRQLLRSRMSKGEYEEAYWGEAYINKLYNKLKTSEIDIILANDISMIPLGVRLGKEKNAKIIADMHEYAPGEFEDIEEWRVLFQEYRYYLCMKYLPNCEKIMTVSRGIADRYKKEFNVEVMIFTNAPQYEKLNVKKTGNDIKIVYHGAANESRHLEVLIDLIKKLDERYTLDFYLIGNEEEVYFKQLTETINNTPRCFLKKPVNPEAISQTLNQYDIGVFLLKPVNFNYKYTLPNKFFEFAQARLAIAIGPSEEMEFYVNKFKCGIVAKDFEPDTLADLINELTFQEIDNFKKNSNELAKEENFEKNRSLLLNLIRELE